MATFTMALKRVIELTGGDAPVVNGVRTPTGTNIGLEWYPIFDEAYRQPLNGKIIDRYWNREIGMETIDLFQLALRRKMNEVMPYFNQLYLSTQLEFDPLRTVDLHTISDRTGAGLVESTSGTTSTSETTNGSESRSVSHEMPQVALSPNGDYATAGVDAKSTGTGHSDATDATTATQDSEDTSHDESTVQGFQGVPSELLMRYRESLLNIDLLVIQELEECFMMVYDTGDSYTMTDWI